jgi:diguanylate cyclase (GGDEF)-like protein
MIAATVLAVVAAMVIAFLLQLLPKLQAATLPLDPLNQNLRRAARAAHALPRQAAGLTHKRPGRDGFDDLASAHHEVHALYDIALAIGGSLDVFDTMAALSAKLPDLVPCASVALFLHEDETDTLRCRFATGTGADVLQQVVARAGKGPTGWVALNRRPLVNADPAADLEAAGLDHVSTTLRSALVCPLIVADRSIGTLSVYHTEGACYRDDHRRLLERVAAQAGAVISNALLFERTKESTLTDELTGLSTMRYLFMHVTRELARAERRPSEVALLVVNLDLEPINDRHGRHVADRALCEAARVLRTVVKPHDVCARYADDFFIVVLSNCGAEEAERTRQALLTRIEETPFAACAGARVPLAVSAGAAVFPHDGGSYEALFATAVGRLL